MHVRVLERRTGDIEDFPRDKYARGRLARKRVGLFTTSAMRSSFRWFAIAASASAGLVVPAQTKVSTGPDTDDVVACRVETSSAIATHADKHNFFAKQGFCIPDL